LSAAAEFDTLVREGVVFMANAMTHITSKMPGARSAETAPALRDLI
jgi:hypothetical protein